jgi:hypothetical protein
MNSSFLTRAGVEFPGGLPLIPSVRLFLAVPWLTLEPGCLTLGEQLRVDSGKPTTPADYGPAEPPGQLSPAPGPRLHTNSQAVAGSLRISFSWRFLSSCRASLHCLLGCSAGRTLVCPQPLLITVQQNLLAAGLLRQVLNFFEIPRRFPGLLRTTLSSRFPGFG